MSDDINPTVESTPNQSATGDMNQRILVVDDDARLRTLLQRFLEDDGYIVRTAHDGSQMDKLMQRELFSLIVLDLRCYLTKTVSVFAIAYAQKTPIFRLLC
ncbi:MAG: response regulator [Moraxella sp.]